METHTVTGPEDLEKLGMIKCEYSEELFYGPLHDRIRTSGAYIDPLTHKIKVIRIMTGVKHLFNESFRQFVSTQKIIWNFPDWQQRPINTMNLEVEDVVQIYVSNGERLDKMTNFYAGEFKVKEIIKGRPKKVIFQK